MKHDLKLIAKGISLRQLKDLVELIDEDIISDSDLLERLRTDDDLYNFLEKIESQAMLNILEAYEISKKN